MPRGSGRRPTPTRLKKLRGNPGKRKLNESEPHAAPGAPALPADLSDLAREEWRRIVPELLKLGVLSNIDGKALAGYCAAWARWVEAERDVARYGLTIEEPIIDAQTHTWIKVRGRRLVRLKRNPAISVAHDAMKIMKSFLIEFGMTPAARSRLSVVKEAVKQQIDPAEKYFDRIERRSGQAIQ